MADNEGSIECGSIERNVETGKRVDNHEMESGDLLHHFFSDVLPDSMAEDLLVRSTASAMQSKLRLCRELQGKTGWHTDACTSEDLIQSLRDAVAGELNEGRLIDIINLAAMIRLRHMVYGVRA